MVIIHKIGCVIVYSTNLNAITKEQLSRSSRAKRGFRTLYWILLGLLSICSGWYFWFTHRPQPRPENRTLFQGITYIRDVRKFPRAIVIHVVTVDLNAPGIGFLVTPRSSGGSQPLRAQTTSEFLKKYGTQVAINCDYFYPYYSDSILHYYPHHGDLVNVEGFAASRGDIYSSKLSKERFPTLYLSRSNAASFRKPDGKIYNAISGACFIVVNGKNRWKDSRATDPPQPYNAIALDKSGRKLILIIVDGRQPKYSEGVTFKEFGNIICAYGGWNAIDTDGGGSESLVMEGPDGLPVPLNESIDCRIPGRERYVANHLGIFADRLP